MIYVKWTDRCDYQRKKLLESWDGERIRMKMRKTRHMEKKQRRIQTKPTLVKDTIDVSENGQSDERDAVSR